MADWKALRARLPALAADLALCLGLIFILLGVSGIPTEQLRLKASAGAWWVIGWMWLRPRLSPGAGREEDSAGSPPDENLSRHGAAALLVAIAAISAALSLSFFLENPLIYMWDAGYYYQHIGEVLEFWRPLVIEAPLAFYYAAPFAYLLDITNGYKVASSLASAAMVLPVYLLARRFGGSRTTAVAAAFVAAFSGIALVMVADLLKNILGLFFGYLFVYFALGVTRRFEAKGAAAALVSAVLMLGSHFSSSAYVFLAVAPFLVWTAASEFAATRRISMRGAFCAGILGLMALSALALAISERVEAGSGKLGVLGVQDDVGVDASPFSLGFFSTYAFVLMPCAAGLWALRKNPMLAAFMVSWLAMTLLLAQPALTRVDFTFRFEWNAYPLMAVLAVLGVQVLAREKPLYYGAIALLAIFTLTGYAESRSHLAPIITVEEWDGLRALHSEHPDMAIGNVGSGFGHWIAAAGFEIEPVAEKGTHLVFSSMDGPSGDPPLWAKRVPPEALAHMEDEGLVTAKIGRFYVVENRDATIGYFYSAW